MTSLLQILVGTCWVIYIFFSEASAIACSGGIPGNCSNSNSELVHVRKESAVEDNDDSPPDPSTVVQNKNKKKNKEEDDTGADEVDYGRINPKCQVHSRGLVGLKSPSSADCVVLPQVVDELATEIILVFNQQEQTIGFYVFEYWNIIKEELKHFEEIYSKFEKGPEPTILEVVQNVSQALDHVKIITLPLQRKIAYLGQLGTSNETLEPINVTLPVRHDDGGAEEGASGRVKRFLPAGINEHLNVQDIMEVKKSEKLTEIPSDRHPSVIMARLESEEYINAKSGKNRRRKRDVKHQHERHHVSHKKRKLLAMGRKIVEMADSHNCSHKNDSGSGAGGGGSSGSGSGGGGGSGYEGGSSSSRNYSGNWWGPLKRVILHLKATDIWMTFLQEFSQALATYEAQSNRIQNVRGNFSDWIGDMEIENDTLREALERIRDDYHLKSLESSLDTLVTEQTPVRLGYLNEMVHAELKTPTKCTVENGVMNVTGSFVFMSEIINCFNDTAPPTGGANVTTVNVVAAHKLFIDQDLNSTTGPSVHPGAIFGMYVFVPDWEVVGGKRELSLTGAPAANQTGAKPGEHGKPGAPGGPGSNFYAVVDNVTGGEMSILVHGGKGGMGYEGTTHAASDNGCAEPRHVVKRNKDGKWEFLCALACALLLSQAKSIPHNPNDESYRQVCPEDCLRWCCWNDFRLARHGGPGGKGGLGGNPGYIEIVSTTSPNTTFSNVITSAERGENGTVGKGAKGEYVKPDEDLGPGDDEYLETALISKQDKLYEEKWCSNRFNKTIKEGFPQLKDGADGEDSRNPKPPEKSADFNLRNIIQAVHQFKIISRASSHLFSRPKIFKYSDYLERNKSMDKVFRTVDFVQEFLDLERQSPQLLKYEPTPLIHYYNSLSRRAIGRLKRGNDSGGGGGEGGGNGTSNMTRAAEVASDDERALLFVHAAASAKTLAFRNPFEPFHITNMLDFLNQEKTTMTELQKSVELTEQYQYLHRLSDGYYKGVLKHFEEAFFYMDKVLHPELAAIRQYLDRIWAFILQTIESLKRQGPSVIKELERYRRELITHTGVTLLFQGIELAGFIVGMFTQSASLLFDAADWVKDLIPGPGRPPSFNLPPIILAGSASAAFRFRTAGLASLNAFMLQMDIVKFVLDSHNGSSFAKSLQVINETNTTVREYLFDPDKTTDDFAPQDAYNSFRLWVGLDLVIKEGQKNVTTALEKDRDNLNGSSSGGGGGGGGQAGRRASSLPAGGHHQHQHHRKHDHHQNSQHNIVKRQGDIMIPMLNEMETVTLALDLAQRGVRYFRSLRMNIEAIIEVGKSIENIKRLLKILEEYEKRVKDGLLEEVNDLFDSLDDLGGDLTDLSKSALNILKWRIQSTIRDMIVMYTNEFIKGFFVEEYMKRAFERLDEAVTTMVTIFERLVDYQDQSKLANFTAAANQNPSYMLGKLSDEILEQKVSGLRFMLQGGVLVKRHTLTASSFRQWSFPFVTPSLCNLNLGQLVANDLADHQQLTVLLGTLLTRTNGMIKTVRDWKNGITPFDKYIIKNRYSHQKPHRPFFRWRNSSHYDDIKSLLSKQTVQLFTKVAEGPKSCEAIKFKQISLYFKASSSSGKEEEKKLLKALEDYKVEMLHMGTSYYSFANETYVLGGQELLFSFSFKVDRHGVPVIKNGVYDKMISGDITTSPYASWSVVIIPVNDDEYTADISPYIGLMDLYLEGNGTCVERQYAQENLHARPDCSDYGKY